ncbi:hypothetical protein BWZ20_06380 [Winogradskyella sp. J14-2]|uniref:hypothetical protein n=1 Tax=Winogradskyella sp. J14-2 TaxID=1936080 RepID=UPI000972968D|nr:hypothetical protein [Winogradskyella sp. J14-2]APY07952.1 hypothetical protein BWZ20_06380 [Winogradskyella sp. J14-2]
MKNNLAPTYQYLFGHYWVLWYKESNSYSIVDRDFKHLLYMYLQAPSLNKFKSGLFAVDSSLDADTVANNLQAYLMQCNTAQHDDTTLSADFIATRSNIFKTYVFNDKAFQVNFDSELVEKTIHPSIAHLEIKEPITPHTTYNIYVENDQLCLFRNETLISMVPKRDYHLIQGKFAMELLSFAHSKEESDWLGTFHGSTIADGNHSILFIGASGKGKSTLCALLATKGFELVADDVSPMLASNFNIYHNPSAVSIKEGSFELLRPLIGDFDSFPNTVFNKTKGIIKYVPCKNPINDKYPCKAIIMVNYKKRSKTKLESISIKEALETLIPESWLSPNPFHAKQFLDWLSQTPVYKLTYSNTESVTREIANCFEQFNYH